MIRIAIATNLSTVKKASILALSSNDLLRRNRI
jgi:hypothetical protein